MDARRVIHRLPPMGAAVANGIVAFAAVVALALATPSTAREPRTPDAPATSKPETRAPAGSKKHAEKRHRKQVGVASVYARRFGGQKMADGNRLDLNDHVAASRTLPLGTEAKVTNLETGKSTQVTIQDRGPYAKGRIIDLTPAAAQSIGLTPKEGVTRVEVQPLSVPPPRDDRKD